MDRLVRIDSTRFIRRSLASARKGLHHHRRNVLSRTGAPDVIVTGTANSRQSTQPREKTTSYSPGWSEVWPSASTSPSCVELTVKATVVEAPGARCTF